MDSGDTNFYHPLMYVETEKHPLSSKSRSHSVFSSISVASNTPRENVLLFSI